MLVDVCLGGCLVLRYTGNTGNTGNTDSTVHDKMAVLMLTLIATC